jgi:hypothetical protein
MLWIAWIAAVAAAKNRQSQRQTKNDSRQADCDSRASAASTGTTSKANGSSIVNVKRLRKPGLDARDVTVVKLDETLAIARSNPSPPSEPGVALRP